MMFFDTGPLDSLGGPLLAGDTVLVRFITGDTYLSRIGKIERDYVGLVRARKILLTVDGPQLSAREESFGVDQTMEHEVLLVVLAKSMTPHEDVVTATVLRRYLQVVHQSEG